MTALAAGTVKNLLVVVVIVLSAQVPVTSMERPANLARLTASSVKVPQAVLNASPISPQLTVTARNAGLAAGGVTPVAANALSATQV